MVFLCSTRLFPCKPEPPPVPPRNPEEEKISQRIAEAVDKNKEVCRRLHKASFEHITRAEDTALVVDVATRQLKQRQAEEVLREVERAKVISTAEDALAVAKRKGKKSR